MRSSRTVPLVVVSLLLPPAVPLARATPIKRTLAELTEVAVRRSRAAAVAEADLAVRRSQKREALWLWAPTGEASLLATGTPRVQCQATAADDYLVSTGALKSDAAALRQRDCVSTIDPSSMGPVSVLNPNIRGIGLQLDARLTQPIYTFGKIERAVDAAGHGIAAAQSQVDAAQREAALLAARAYWAVKSARAAAATLEDARQELRPWVERIAKDLESAKPKYTVGDLKRLQMVLADVDEGAGSLELKTRVALGGLRILVGEDVDVDDAELDLVEVVDLPIDYYRDASRRARPELHALDEGVLGLRSLADARRNEMLPDLGLVLALQWRYASSIEDSQSAFDNHGNQLGLGLFLALRQPLDLFAKAARWRHAQADAAVMDAHRDMARAGVDFEIERAYADLAEARRRHANLDAAQRRARGWFTADSQNVDQGTEEPRQLVESARSYFDHRLRYYQAIADVNLGLAQLRRASGLDKDPAAGHGSSAGAAPAP